MTKQRIRLTVRGAVQGVGFRPFIYRLATSLRLRGWVANSTQGVRIELEGDRSAIDEFLLKLENDKPALAAIRSVEMSELEPVDYLTFGIRDSDTDGDPAAFVLPDIATCPECLRELFDPSNRRYRYPFTNCTNCGPRYSIMTSLPYDRAGTSMRHFTMCPECRSEYENPDNRRFHAQPNACPACGPGIELWNPGGATVADGHQALLRTASALRRGEIVALKGIGGFQLLVDARRDDAVRRLRTRKHREEKPFAVMFPDIALVHSACEVAESERRLLASHASPIVLLKIKSRSAASRVPHPVQAVAPSVAPANPMLGVMLPYSPLHHLLMHELGFPVVATSGNISDEPICTDAREALERLHGIADLFLVHNRPIVHHADDSVVRVIMNRELMLRRARGYAPLPIELPDNGEGDAAGGPVIAVGGHMKNAVAFAAGRNVVVSQHIGDLQSLESREAFRETLEGLQHLYRSGADRIVADFHPDYASTNHALRSGIPVILIQHHHAHVASCMAENRLSGSVLGVSWDGTGLGADGTIWGGEFLLTTTTGFERKGALRPFALPGGERAVHEPRFTALGVLYEIFGERVFGRHDLLPLAAFKASEAGLLCGQLRARINTPRTTSAGRLFDAVSSILGIRHVASFEGQAAMELEYAIGGIAVDDVYEYGIGPRDGPLLELDWRPVIEAIVRDTSAGESPGRVSARFHNTLAEMIVAVADRLNEQRVVLSGGCFQNAYLLERTVRRLQREGFRPYWHQRVPPNDGGLALGQIYAARLMSHAGRRCESEQPHRITENNICA